MSNLSFFLGTPLGWVPGVHRPIGLRSTNRLGYTNAFLSNLRGSTSLARLLRQWTTTSGLTWLILMPFEPMPFEPLCSTDVFLPSE